MKKKRKALAGKVQDLCIRAHALIGKAREKAREMLLETELSVSEIALLCGFGSISQFNRVFREVVRQTPREFRAAKR